jgi:nitroreductase
MSLDLSADSLLTTTRAVRKRLDFDRPVNPQLIRECLEVALQAPSGSNSQGWHFVVVTDAAKRQRIGELYSKGFDIYRNMQQSAHALAEAQTEEADARQMERVVDSAEYLAANLHRAPVMVIPCVEGRTDTLQGQPSPTQANTARSCPRSGASCWRPGPGVWVPRGPRSI